MNFNRPRIALIALAIALTTTPALAATNPWKAIHPADLEVTSGAISPAGKTTLRTRDAEMRAVVRDGGRHANRARLRFKLLGDSQTTKPLGSGLVRRQIGLKVNAADPCNLVYVMWRAYPDRAIEISTKRNPGQTTSAQCGNRGYTDVAVIPRPAAPNATHTLEVRTRRVADGGLVVAVYADARLARRVTLGPELASGLEGPVGVRSDNGDYLFRLSTRRR